MSVDVEKSSSSSDEGWWEIAKIVIHAIILAFLVRLFIIQPFNIPSGSMQGNLLIGDYLFVSKYSYGYSKHTFGFDLFEGRIFGSQPERGDVVVFKLPRDTSQDYIKRVIGLPGDKIQMIGGILHINGTPISKKPAGTFIEDVNDAPVRRFEETLPNGVKYLVLDAVPHNGRDYTDNTDVYVVPEGHYFMMGDNRDNSSDSRDPDVSFVPFENLVGEAQMIFFSKGEASDPSSGLFNIRWSRIFKTVN
ncbi:MAG: signal peptidase I [Rhodomicrobium sp.]|nr:MAG: signal peptidase I [Rhodomicrobium sp.]